MCLDFALEINKRFAYQSKSRALGGWGESQGQLKIFLFVQDFLVWAGWQLS